MIGLFVVLAGAWFHRFWAVEDPQQKQFQMQLFFRNLTFLGTALVFFGIFSTVGHELGLMITGPLFDLR